MKVELNTITLILTFKTLNHNLLGHQSFVCVLLQDKCCFLHFSWQKSSSGNILVTTVQSKTCWYWNKKQQKNVYYCAQKMNMFFVIYFRYLKLSSNFRVRHHVICTFTLLNNFKAFVVIFIKDCHKREWDFSTKLTSKRLNKQNVDSVTVRQSVQAWLNFCLTDNRYVGLTPFHKDCIHSCCISKTHKTFDHHIF